MKHLYIGLLSGTSMDGIDAGLFEIDASTCTTMATLKVDYPPELRSDLLRASRNPDTCNVDDIGRLDHLVGTCFMNAAKSLLASSATDSSRVRAIGSHGQTILHRPRARHPFTMQIGDPNIIAAGTGIDTVADFRRRDVALGGEGAPLATAFHKWFLADSAENRVVLNIGGIANITVLPATGDAVFGFDTGPGNTLLDAWIQSRRNREYDRNGNWGDSGRVSERLLEVLLDDPYFRSPPPKSTGFEYFNLAWLQRSLALCHAAGMVEDEDVQATLARVTTITIRDAVLRHAPETRRMLVCGGGVHNGAIMRDLQSELPDVAVESSIGHGMDPDWVEAATFAWLAKRCLDRQSGNLPRVTGAVRETVLGAVYFH